MSAFTKYKALVFSRADFSDGVGYSSVQDDFPMELGPAALYDTVTGIQRFVGRDPATGLPLMVTGYDRYITDVVTDGVTGASDGISPPYGVAPDVCSVTVGVTAASVLAAINGAAKHLVYGVWNVQDGAEPDDLPPALAPFYIDTPMSAELKTTIATGLINRGADETKVNNWFTNHPNATADDLHGAFSKLVEILTEQAGG
jgi:hypothetical protein